MNFHRSTDHGGTWKIISSELFYDAKINTYLIMSTGIPENMVSVKPESFWSATTLSGIKWAGMYVSFSIIKNFTITFKIPVLLARSYCL